MTILWCGGEDLDFSNAYNGATYFNIVYERTAVVASLSYGAISIGEYTKSTSIWLSFRVRHLVYILMHTGVILHPTNKGIYVGQTSVGSGKACIIAYDGTSITILASESGTSLVSTATQRIDMQITEYGSSANVKLYVNGNLVIDYTGDVTIAGVDGFSGVCVKSTEDWGGTSSIIVADEDTRLMCLKTFAPDSAGDTSANWTGTYEDINETTISDSDKIASATDNADFQCNLTGMPSGAWSVKAVKIAARCVDGSGTKGIALGIKSGGTVNVGNTETCAGYWQTKERLMQVNPVTGVAFTPAEIEALQINLRAKAL